MSLAVNSSLHGRTDPLWAQAGAYIANPKQPDVQQYR